LAQEWDPLGLGHALFLDTGPLAGNVSTFFALLGLPEKPEPIQHLLMQAVLPQLHVALLRVQYDAEDDRVAEAPAPAEADSPTLTDRQTEILHWVRLGKTNFEIALILNISVLTVKTTCRNSSSVSTCTTVCRRLHASWNSASWASRAIPSNHPSKRSAPQAVVQTDYRAGPWLAGDITFVLHSHATMTLKLIAALGLGLASMGGLPAPCRPVPRRRWPPIW